MTVTSPARLPRGGVLSRFRSESGVVDLGSIMVGVVILGIISGIIAASVFVLIPWSQDEAAKQDLNSVNLAESVARVTAHQYETVDDLVSGGFLPASSEADGGTLYAGSHAGVGLMVPADDSDATEPDQVVVSVNGTGSCYIAAIESPTENIFYVGPQTSGVQVVPAGEPSPDTSSCAPFPEFDLSSPTGTPTGPTGPSVPTYTVSSLAGNGGPSASPGFVLPDGASVGPDGNIYVTDSASVRWINPQGQTTTIVPNSEAVSYGLSPALIAVDPSSGTIYTGGGNTSKGEIFAVSTSGNITPFAGSTTLGHQDGTGTSAEFGAITALTTDSAGNVYAGDDYVNGGNNIYFIRKITAAGVVTTIAGTGTYSATMSTGPVSSAVFGEVTGLAVDSSGNVYFTDGTSMQVKELSTSGSISIYSGATPGGKDADGTASTATFTSVSGLTIDTSGDLYVSEQSGDTIREITPGGAVTTIAGDGTLGLANGSGSSAEFSHPEGITVAPDGIVYVADYGNAAFRELVPPGVTIPVTTAPPTPPGPSYTVSEVYTASLVTMQGVAMAPNGNVDAATTNGVYTITPSGTATQIITAAQDSANKISPTDIAIDSAGDIFTGGGNTSKGEVFELSSSGTLAALAGGSTLGHADGTGTSAEFTDITALATDSTGNIYVGDEGTASGHTIYYIRKITPAGAVTTIAGSGTYSATATAGTALGTAVFGLVGGIAVDQAGNVYFSDQTDGVIWELNTAGNVSLYAGTIGGATDANGNALSAKFDAPGGVSLDSNDDLFVSEQSGDTIREISNAGAVSTVAGVLGSAGIVEGAAATAKFSAPKGVTVAPNGNLYVADSNNYAVRAITPTW